MPELGREYKAQLSYFESAILLLLRYARVATIILTAWAALRLTAVGDTSPLNERWILFAVGVATVFVLTKLVRIYR